MQGLRRVRGVLVGLSGLVSWSLGGSLQATLSRTLPYLNRYPSGAGSKIFSFCDQDIKGMFLFGIAAI